MVNCKEKSVKYQTRELISAIVVLAGALLVIFFIIPNFIEMDQEYDLVSMSPDFFPRLAGWIIAILAGLHLFFLMLQRQKTASDDKQEAWLSAVEERSAYKSALVIILYFIAMKYVGFLISTPILLAVLLIFQDERKPLKIILVSVLVTICVFLFFYFVMQVHFPKGLIFE